MLSFPKKAQYYLYSTFIVGLISALVIIYNTNINPPSYGWETWVFAALGLILGGRKVVLMHAKNHESSGELSLGFIIIFSSLLRLGPQGASLIGLMVTITTCIYPVKASWFQALFNLSCNLFQTLVASAVFFTLNNNTIVLNSPYSLVAIFASCLTFWLINTGSVSIIIALCSQQTVKQVWNDFFLWTWPSFLIGAAAATMAVYLMGEHFWQFIIFAPFVAAIIWFTHRSYKSYAARTDALLESKEELADLYLATIRSLATAIEAKDQYMQQHIIRVQKYALAIATEMGLHGDELNAIETSALLHDIGKMGVPDYVLHKPGRLTDEEFAKIKEHPRIGADILDPVAFPYPVIPGVKYHHEHWDGSGYPEGLKGLDIPLQARIMAVADVYDALTSERSYRSAWPHDKALAQVRASAGSQFDPDVVDAFARVIEMVRQEIVDGDMQSLTYASPTYLTSIASPVTTARATNAIRDIRRASSDVYALYEISQTLSTCLGFQETVEIMARKLEAILPGATCLFLMFDDTKETLMARAAVGTNREYFTNCRNSDANSISLRVARTLTTYNGAFDVEDLLPQSAQVDVWEEQKSALIVPIVHQGEVLGTINIYHEQDDAFRVHEQNLLEMIAERTAMALWNGMLYDRTRSEAQTDPLTGLANVRYMVDLVEQRCRQEDNSNGVFALLCIDLNSFKPINDNFGHQKGDQVLRDLAPIFKSTVGESNIVARYGGDEFVILLEGVDSAKATQMAQRIQEAVEEYNPGLVHAKLGALRISASIGIACYPSDGTNWVTLLSVADSHMYRQKSEHKLRRLVGNVPVVTHDDTPRRWDYTTGSVPVSPGQVLPIAADDTSFNAVRLNAEKKAVLRTVEAGKRRQPGTVE